MFFVFVIYYASQGTAFGLKFGRRGGRSEKTGGFDAIIGRQTVLGQVTAFEFIVHLKGAVINFLRRIFFELRFHPYPVVERNSVFA